MICAKRRIKKRTYFICLHMHNKIHKKQVTAVAYLGKAMGG